MDRREFLGLLTLASGASLLAGCDLTRKSEKLIPYLVPPDDGILPGQATFVNTSCTECPANCGMTARIRDLRPVKVDGCANHPVNDGALCLRGQASLSRLYHVDRLRQPLVKDPAGKLVPGTWADALKRCADALHGQGEHVLLSKRTTGSLSALMDDFASRTGVQRAPEYELLSNAAIREANRSIFDRAVVPLLHPDRADLIVTVGADVIETFGNPVQFTTGLTKKRGNGQRVTWYHAEPHASMSGFKADHRLVVKPGSEGFLLAYLLHTVAQTKSVDARVSAHVRDVPMVDLARAAQATGLAPDVVASLGTALTNSSSPLLVAGGVSTGQESGLDVARIAALIQAACGMQGKTVDFAQAQDYSRVGSMSDIDRLMTRLDGGSVGTLILFNIDPVSQLPMGDKFAQSVDHAAFVIGVADILTPTMERADVVLPLSHTLESWGDAEPATGVLNVIQPTFAPLFDTASDGDVLLRLMIATGAAAAGTTYQQYVSDRWAKDFGPDAPATMLKQGWIARAGAAETAAAREPDHKYSFDTAAAHAGAVLMIIPSVRFYDGRSSELPFLHEIPDPLTSVTWDSWVSAGKETLDKLGAAEEEMLDLKGDGWSLALPARAQPGLGPDVFVVQRGTSNPAVGWSRLSGEALTVANVTAAGTGNRYRLSKTAGSLYEEGRGIVPGHEPTHFNGHPLEKPVATASPGGERDQFTFYPVPKYPTYRWAMAVDLDKCTGCSACVAACTIENNVPMVGRESHLKGREMAWIRLEQYYEKDGSDANFVPAMCQQCDFAPCESVCPVFATYHNDEGLNAQVYNRCVGTRYCGNNCPYKQRRFNFFEWGKRPHPLNLMTNPDVSVRNKGVMEKCTFCIQRVRHARDVAKDEKRKIQEGDITPACAQACPGKAIVFGNLLDESSEVHKWAHDARSSRILEELGTSPGVFYLKKNGGAEHGA
jgi:molybdopterin-containing oxidoreductase family iron-sulfur binding subunit